MSAIRKVSVNPKHSATVQKLVSEADTILASSRNKLVEIDLTFNFPQQTKLDRRATKELAQREGMKGDDPVKVIKSLYAKKDIDPLKSIEGACRKWLNGQGNIVNGKLLIPVTSIGFVMEELDRNWFEQFKQAKVVFGNNYAKILRDAEQQLAGLYDETVYPSVFDVVNQFTAQYDLYPVGGSVAELFDHIEADVAEDVARAMRDTQKRRNEEIMEKPIKKLIEMVMNMHQKAVRGSDPDAKVRWHESNMEELEELTRLIPELNITGSSWFDDIAMKARKLCVGVDAIKQEGTRGDVAKEASELLSQLGVDPNHNVNSVKSDNSLRGEVAKQKAQDILAQMKGLF